MTKRGRFITFEGGEGVGKSTQCQGLADFLENQGIDVILTREPGGAVGAEAIRGLLTAGAADRWDPLAETLLHAAARREHLDKTVLPAIEKGVWVICDRFADSTEAYQGHGQGVDMATIGYLRRAVVGSNEPDLTLILDMPVAAGLARAKARDEEVGRYERMTVDLHHRVHDGFLDIAASNPDRCVIVNAEGSETAVQAEIQNVVSARLGVAGDGA